MQSPVGDTRLNFKHMLIYGISCLPLSKLIIKHDEPLDFSCKWCMCYWFLLVPNFKEKSLQTSVGKHTRHGGPVLDTITNTLVIPPGIVLYVCVGYCLLLAVLQYVQQCLFICSIWLRMIVIICAWDEE